MAESTEVVQITGVSKSFGGTRALSDVSLSIGRGEVHGLLGRNGAGKSTLVSALAGLVKPDAGDIRIMGRSAWNQSGTGDPSVFASVAMVHQTPALVDSLSVAENLQLEPGSRKTRLGFISVKEMKRDAETLLARWGLDLDPNRTVSGLSPAERHLLAIARAMARDAAVVILDEPTAALPAPEVERLFESLRTMRSLGRSFIYISHHLEEVRQICDSATVMRDGQVVARRAHDELDIKDLATLVAGRELASVEKRSAVDPAAGAAALLELNGLRATSRSHGVDLTIHAGQVHALTGLLGSGAEQVAEVVAGAIPPLSGQVLLGGRDVTAQDRSGSVASGVGYVPGDRHTDGYIGILGVRENTELPMLRRLSNRLGILRTKDEVRLADTAVREYDIKVSSIDQPVGSLSGGNQQKVVIARALATGPRLLVAIHPTRGVDVGAKDSIYALLHAFVDQGNAVLLVTDELAELDALATTVTVMRQGDVVEQYRQWTHNELLLAMEGKAVVDA